MLENFSTWLRQRGEQKLRRRAHPLSLVPKLRVHGFLRYPCPCCGLPTIDEPGIYDICAVCWWEDDGHDGESPYSPNRVSLARARANFRANLSMFAAGEEPEGFADSEEQKARKRALLSSFELLRSDTDSGSQEAIREEIKRAIEEIRREK